jgi:hypothetical protein
VTLKVIAPAPVSTHYSALALPCAHAQSPVT